MICTFPKCKTGPSKFNIMCAKKMPFSNVICFQNLFTSKPPTESQGKAKNVGFIRFLKKIFIKYNRLTHHVRHELGSVHGWNPLRRHGKDGGPRGTQEEAEDHSEGHYPTEAGRRC